MSSRPESAVRVYLQALRDPGSVRAEEEIERLGREIDAEPDPVKRLRLRAELDKAENVSASDYEAGFIEHAKAYLGGLGIGAKALQAEGVSSDVLKRAGFNVGRTKTSSARKSAPGPRKPRVSSDDIRAAIPKKGSFTLRDLQEATGASVGAVRSVIKAEMDAAKVVQAGTADKSGPGRAPTLYARA